jgi:hypothetical protein
VRVFAGATFGLLRELVGAVSGDRLGWDVAGLADFDSDGSGDVIVGEPGVDLGLSTDAGRARIFSVATGALLADTLNGYHAAEMFGQSVSSAGDLNHDGATDALAGSPLFDGNYPDGGRVRVVLGSAEVPTTYCTPKVNSAGCTPSIGFTGCASLTLGSGLGIHSLDQILGVNGMMIWSLAPHSAPFHGGTLCVHSPIRRTAVQTSYDDPYSSLPCAGAFYYLFTGTTMAANGLTAGDTIHAQFWSRDNGYPPPNNIGLTAGLKAVVLP